MNINTIPFQAIDWTSIPKVEHKGETGTSFWQTIQLAHLRLRIVEYSPGYMADHWCSKGHIVECIEGEFINELKSGEKNTMKKGMVYVVSDEASTHRSVSINGAKLFVVDGDFLK